MLICSRLIIIVLTPKSWPSAKSASVQIAKYKQLYSEKKTLPSSAYLRKRPRSYGPLNFLSSRKTFPCMSNRIRYDQHQFLHRFTFLMQCIQYSMAYRQSLRTGRCSVMKNKTLDLRVFSSVDSNPELRPSYPHIHLSSKFVNMEPNFTFPLEAKQVRSLPPRPLYFPSPFLAYDPLNPARSSGHRAVSSFKGSRPRSQKPTTCRVGGT